MNNLFTQLFVHLKPQAIWYICGSDFQFSEHGCRAHIYGEVDFHTQVHFSVDKSRHKLKIMVACIRKQPLGQSFSCPILCHSVHLCEVGTKCPCSGYLVTFYTHFVPTLHRWWCPVQGSAESGPEHILCYLASPLCFCLNIWRPKCSLLYINVAHWGDLGYNLIPQNINI